MIFPYTFLLPPSFLTFVKKPDQPIFLLFRKKMYINLHLLFQNTRKLLSKPQNSKPPPLVGRVFGVPQARFGSFDPVKTPKRTVFGLSDSNLVRLVPNFVHFWSFLAIFGDFWASKPHFGVPRPHFWGPDPLFDPPNPILGVPNPILGFPDPIFGVLAS